MGWGCGAVHLARRRTATRSALPCPECRALPDRRPRRSPPRWHRRWRGGPLRSRKQAAAPDHILAEARRARPLLWPAGKWKAGSQAAACAGPGAAESLRRPTEIGATVGSNNFQSETNWDILLLSARHSAYGEKLTADGEMRIGICQKLAARFTCVPLRLYFSAFFAAYSEDRGSSPYGESGLKCGVNFSIRRTPLWRAGILPTRNSRLLI